MGKKLDTTLDFLSRRGWKALKQEIKEAIQGKEKAAEQLLYLGTVEQLLDSESILLYRATLLKWFAEGKPPWRMGTTKDQILKAIRKIKVGEIKKWFEQEEKKALQQQRQLQQHTQPTTHQDRPEPPPRQRLLQGRLPQGRVPQGHVQTTTRRPTRIPPSRPLHRPPPRVPLRLRRRLSVGPTSITQPGGVNLLKAAQAHDPKWKKIEITDIPTGEVNRFGVPKYITTDKDREVNRIGAGASGIARRITKCGVGKHESKPVYWIALGRMVMSGKVARCFACAAAAVYTLVLDSKFDSEPIEVIGNRNSDHYFAVVARSGSKGKVGQDIGTPGKWGSALVVDIWQSNLDVQLKKPEKTPSVMYAQQNDYAKRGGNELFCRLAPADRTAHKKLAKDKKLLK